MSDNTKSRPRGMGRRDVLKAFGAASLSLASGLVPLFSRAEGAPKAPNIIFILSDDHRWDHLGILGHPFLKTPNLDRLAREGVLFNNAFVTTSLCSPSRASFLTGNYPHTHGVMNNLTPWNPENETYLDILGLAGYRTAFIGKWHMPGALPELPEVDHFITFTVQGGQGRYFNCPLIVDGKTTPSRKEYITEELTDRAIEFIEASGDRPFCLHLAHKAAHHQFLPPPDLAGMYDEPDLDLPPEMDPHVTFTAKNLLFGVLGPVELHYRNYCETLTALDRETGRLLDALDRLDLTRETIVVYAGDNGYFWGEHNLVDKRYAYEESIRIPFIVRYPQGITKPGQRADQMILNVDLAPTLLELAGLEPPARMEGESFAPVLASAEAPGREAWLYEYFRDYPYRNEPHYAVRTLDRKYIEFEGRRDPELYDLEADPKEMDNLYGRPGWEEEAARLKKLLDELKAGIKAPQI